MDIIQILLAIVGFFFVHYFKELATSVKELNVKMGVIVERISAHGEEIAIHREKLDTILIDVASLKATNPKEN